MIRAHKNIHDATSWPDGNDSMKRESDEYLIRRIPRLTPGILRMRLSTGGLKLLHSCGRTNLSSAERLSPLCGHELPLRGSLIQSGRDSNFVTRIETI